MHIPALRLGRTYESLDKVEVKDCRTGEVKATVSTVNAGILRKDLRNLANPLKKFTHAQLIELTAKAADIFVAEPDQYVANLSATSGLPHVLVRRNLQRIHGMMSNIGAVLRGLTRGLDLDDAGSPYSFYPATKCLGLIMPSNSPAVNSLWLPAIALKIPVIIKPGREEPWTPYRLIHSFIQAGAPAEAFGFYPTDHEGSGAILNLCGRSLLFGDKSVADQYAGNPAIQVHGPGYSKVLIGEDQIDRWPEFLDVLVDSVSANGGRSCLNASAIVVPRHADAIADALAQRLGPIAPLPATDENARLSGFANPKMADAIDAGIEQSLPGATDVTAKYRQGPRKFVFEGATYLRPTIVRCPSFAHSLAGKEYLFPYASVVEVPQAQMLSQIGPSLVVTAITRDESWIAELKESGYIDRLNIGPISTMKISWDQPHEGNLFEFLYKRRAFERQ
jgi:acyl-CoA reductase-like NAD-dependent aldehyde dehydrogenase